MEPIFVSSLREQGFAIVPALLGADDAVALRDELGKIGHDETLTEGSAVRQKGGRVYAVRNLLRVPAVARLAQTPAVRSVVEAVLGASARVVRGILFDKTGAANWKVCWHQDVSIAVRRRAEVPGFGPWSVKAGVPHVRPPRVVLERMLAVRISLDDCGAENGPLMVLPASHSHGILSEQQIGLLRHTSQPVICAVPCGGALLMRPLLVHASGEARSVGHRRVAHLEFAAGELAEGLEWHEVSSEEGTRAAVVEMGA